MIKRMLIAKVSAIAGSAAILVGALDPLEGAFIIFPGSGLIAFGACLAQTRHRRLTYWAFLLIVASFAALLIMTVLGGIGGHAPIFRSPWWSLVFLPYPVGWMMDIVGATYALSSLFT
ncbi:MAG: hypothetical protein NTU83_07265, partial [Candidatus Hydrogenedentes bacterium]|nr:hypothetical protein [Candidatus Hydrogenedentota bacterium]